MLAACTEARAEPARTGDSGEVQLAHDRARYQRATWWIEPSDGRNRAAIRHWLRNRFAPHVHRLWALKQLVHISTHKEPTWNSGLKAIPTMVI